jgi:hypothetical protein
MRSGRNAVLRRRQVFVLSQHGMTQRRMQLSQAAFDIAIRLISEFCKARRLIEREAVPEGKVNGYNKLTGGEAGIRTLDTGFSPYNGLANRRLQPLGHLTAHSNSN